MEITYLIFLAFAFIFYLLVLFFIIKNRYSCSYSSAPPAPPMPPAPPINQMIKPVKNFHKRIKNKGY